MVTNESNESVHDRIELARTTLTPGQLAAGLALVAAIAYMLVFIQEPLAHDSMHNFRHATGITCH